MRYHIFKSHAYWCNFSFPFLLVPQTTLHIGSLCFMADCLLPHLLITGWLLTIYSTAWFMMCFLALGATSYLTQCENLRSDTIPDFTRIVLCASMFSTQGVRWCSYLPFALKGVALFCGQVSRELSKASITLLALYTKLAKIWLLVLCHAYYADYNIETQESEYYKHGC